MEFHSRRVDDKVIHTQANMDRIGLDILSYLYPIEICNLRRSCWTFGFMDATEGFSNFWRFLCKKRWKCNESIILRMANNLRNWSRVYGLLGSLPAIPRGAYTEKHNPVFGSSDSKSGVVSWFLLGHSSDCRPHNFGQRDSHINIRICVQNVSFSRIFCDLKSLDIMGLSEELIPIRLRFSDKVSVISINGSKVTEDGKYIMAPITEGNSDISSNELVLDYLDCAVITTSVYVDENIENEVDFLVQLRKITLFYSISKISTIGEAENAVSTSNLKHAVECNIIGEEEVWNFYNPLPRNAVLLRRDCEANITG